MLTDDEINYFRAKLPDIDAPARIDSAMSAATEYVDQHAANMARLIQHGIYRAVFLYVLASDAQEKEQLRYSIDALLACGRATSADS